MIWKFLTNLWYNFHKFIKYFSVMFIKFVKIIFH